MNVAVPPEPSGSVVLRPGRVYRALVVITGAAMLEDLAESLFGTGFDPSHFAASAPADWPAAQPADWPAEPVLELCANECVVRMSGRFNPASATSFAPDLPLGRSGAMYTLAAVWEVRGARPPSREPRAAAGAAPPATAPEPSDKARNVAMLAAAAGLFGLGFWQHRRSEQRFEREQERLRKLIDTHQRERAQLRARTLERHGLSPADAERQARGVIPWNEEGHAEETAENLD